MESEFPSEDFHFFPSLGGGDRYISVFWKIASGNSIFVLVPAGGHFFSTFFGPLGPYDFPGKTSKIVRTSDFSP